MKPADLATAQVTAVKKKIQKLCVCACVLTMCCHYWPGLSCKSTTTSTNTTTTAKNNN